jgi:hypothetical protein
MFGVVLLASWLEDRPTESLDESGVWDSMSGMDVVILVIFRRFAGTLVRDFSDGGKH